MITNNTVTGNQQYGMYLRDFNPATPGNHFVDQNVVLDNNKEGGNYSNISSCSSCTFGNNHAP